MKDMNIYRRAVSLTNLFLSLVLVVFSFTAINGQTAATAQVASAASLQTSYADLVTRVSPAVVTIRSTERARNAQQFPFMDDPSLRDFFGDRMPQQQRPERVQGVGSGVIVNSEG